MIGNCRGGLPINGNKHNMKHLKMNDGKLMMEYIQEFGRKILNLSGILLQKFWVTYFHLPGNRKESNFANIFLNFK